MRHALLALFVLVGCDDGGSSTPDAAGNPDSGNGSGSDSGGTFGFDVAGQVNGTSPANSTLAVAWIVSSGSPDYAWKFGEGTVTGSTFLVSLHALPPAQALNSYGVGVGMIVQLPPGTTIPDGEIPEATFDTATGFTPEHSIIYKADSAQQIEWIEAFPAGYSCGVCTRSGSGFDGFAPTECSNVKLEQGLDADACNWT